MVVHTMSLGHTDSLLVGHTSFTNSSNSCICRGTCCSIALCLLIVRIWKTSSSGSRQLTSQRIVCFSQPFKKKARHRSQRRHAYHMNYKSPGNNSVCHLDSMPRSWGEQGMRSRHPDFLLRAILRVFCSKKSNRYLNGIFKGYQTFYGT